MPGGFAGLYGRTLRSRAAHGVRPYARDALRNAKARSQARGRPFLQSTSCVAVLEDVINPTNLGAIFRSAAALGVEAVLLTESCTDPLYRRCIRVSMGNVFLCRGRIFQMINGRRFCTKTALRASRWPCARTRRSYGIRLCGKSKKLAVVMGSEGPGLKASTIASCDYTVTVPMTNGVDSLNVAAPAPWRSISFALCGSIRFENAAAFFL